MRAGRVIVIVLLLPTVGCMMRPSKTQPTGEDRPQATHLSTRDERLFEAVQEGNVEEVRSLIAEGADANARDEGDATPLHRAAAAGRIEMVDLLITRGANVNATGGFLGGTPLCEAVAADYSMIAGEFLKAERPDLSHTDKFYEELKEKWAEQFMLDIVRTLIAHGADVNAKDEHGGRVLDYVLTDTPIEVVRLLLISGANPGLRGDDGTCVFHTAVAQGRTDLITLFLDSGTKVDARDTDQQTALHEAVWQDNKVMVKLLLAHGAEVNAKDKRRDTPLHIAAVNGYKELFDLLVSKGADGTAKNKRGLTPLGYARSMPPKEMIRLTPKGSRPYSVVITRVSEIRSLLRKQRIEYDWIWIPGEADIKHAEAILTRPRETAKDKREERLLGPEPVFADLSRYNREFAGFESDRVRFVLCWMNRGGADMRPSENRFSWPGMDEWGVYKLAVVALDTGQIEWIKSEYF